MRKDKRCTQDTDPPYRGPDIAILADQPDFLIARLAERFTVHPVFRAADPLSDLGSLGEVIRGVVTTGFAGLSRAAIDRLPHLEICTISGVGLETTDLPTCRERGIVVTTAPVMFEDVADLAIGLALAACRRIAQGDRYVREGQWGRSRFPPGRKLSGMRAGILGMGRIGVRVARRLEGFGGPIAYYDPAGKDMPYERVDDAMALASAADILFLCAAGPPKGSGAPIVDRAMIEAIGPRGVFVNVARGWLVDEAALCEALRNGRLGAAGLDVFEDEPNLRAELRSLENVVLCPHVASHTEETQMAMAQCVVDNLESWFAGRGPLTPLALTENRALT